MNSSPLFCHHPSKIHRISRSSLFIWDSCELVKLLFVDNVKIQFCPFYARRNKQKCIKVCFEVVLDKIISPSTMSGGLW